MLLLLLRGWKEELVGSQIKKKLVSRRNALIDFIRIPGGGGFIGNGEPPPPPCVRALKGQCHDIQ